MWDSSQSNQELSEIDPATLVTFKRNEQKRIVNGTIEFAIALQSCEAIVDAAYKVADYRPPFQNGKQSDFWSETINPVLVQSLQQDVKARSVISRTFGTVGDLASVIQRVYDILVRSRGSKKAIEIAQKNIPGALSKLNECITLVEQLDSKAFTNFAQQTNKIFDIIGPEAAKFAEQKEALDEKIQKNDVEQRKLISEFSVKKGEVESLNYLIEATKKHVKNTDDNLQEAQKRKSELDNMNDQIEKTIHNIPQKIQKTVTNSGSSGWWFWRRSWNITHTFDVDNPDRESQHRYYDNVIKSRLERLQSTEKSKKESQAAMETLQMDIARYTNAYEKAKKELENLQKTFEARLQDIQSNIISALDAKQKIEKSALDTFEKIGLQGNTLVAALVQVRIFARSLPQGGSVYSPFATVLNTIKNLVQSDVDLLTSDEPANIFLAATLLIEQVKFLSDYAVRAQHIMKTTRDYDQPAITQRMQAITL